MEILEFIKKELKSTHPIRYIKSDYISFSVSCKKIVEDLNKLSIIKNKTYNTLTLPYVNEKFLNHFIRGFFDGDGCIYNTIKKPNDFCVNFSNNYGILLELKNIFIKKLDISPYIRLRHKDNLNSAMLEFKGSLQIERFYNYIYNNTLFFMKRKHDKFKIPLENAKLYKLTNYEHNGIWYKIYYLYIKQTTQKEISNILNINYSSIRTCVQKMRKRNIIK